MGQLFDIDKEGNKRPVGRPKIPVEFTSPHPSIYSLSADTDPVALKTEIVTQGQIRPDEKTLIWGLDDAEPLHILDAIAKSPTATSCIGKIETYTKGSGFSDPGLMDLVINADGDTLWDLHCAIVQYYSALDGFAVNFKYNQRGKIVSAYNMALDSCRLAAEPDTNKISCLKYNPYFGTREYNGRYTTPYPLFDPAKLKQDIAIYGDKFEGQAYFFGTKRTLFKHYPLPKFWSGKKWIYSDAKFATYIEKLLDNGFFESVLMKVIGDPNRPSNHPDAMKEIVGEDGVKRKESVKTEGQMFNDMMSKNFSGVEKAGKVMAFWSLNKDQSISLEAFPTNVSPDLVSGALLETIRMIAISTEVPAILANLPNSLSSLASGGDALKNAVEFMQANTAPKRAQLEKFYNNVLLPNLETKTKATVKIQQYSPVTTKVVIDEKTWQFMNEAEKIRWIEKNDPNVEIIRTPAASINMAPATIDENGTQVAAPTAPTVDENLKSMKVSEINRILSIVKKFNAGQLTMEQAKQLLAGYGLNEEQQTAWLNPNPVEL